MRGDSASLVNVADHWHNLKSQIAIAKRHSLALKWLPRSDNVFGIFVVILFPCCADFRVIEHAFDLDQRDPFLGCVVGETGLCESCHIDFVFNDERSVRN